jgi:hypothetical protein
VILFSGLCFAADMHTTSICTENLRQDFPQFENSKMQDYSFSPNGIPFSSVEWSFKKLATGTYEVTETSLWENREKKWKNYSCLIGGHVILESAKDKDTGRFSLKLVQFNDDGIKISTVLKYNEDKLKSYGIPHGIQMDGTSPVLVVDNSGIDSCILLNSKECHKFGFTKTFRIVQ